MTRGRTRIGGIPLLLATLTLALAVWQILAHRSRAPWKPFRLQASDFVAFSPAGDGWQVAAVGGVNDDPTAPMLFAFALRRSLEEPMVIVRLAHGYNMPDCMRIKQYRVSVREDGHARAEPQCWLLTGPAGDASYWQTLLLGDRHFDALSTDIGALPFPRVAGAADAEWSPRGITRASLRDPVRGFRRFLRSRWNASRSDLATFLRWRQPAWASDEVLVLLAHATVGQGGGGGGVDAEAVCRRAVEDAHAHVLARLRAWAPPAVE